MTATTSAPSRAAAPGTTPTLRQLLRRWRFWAIVFAVLVVVAIGSQLVSFGGADTADFAPGNARPNGGMALAQVLREQGVDVRTTSDLDDAVDAPGALLVDDSDDLLSAADWRRIAAGRQRIVVVAPSSEALAAVLPSASSHGAALQSRVAAGCDLALARRAGSMSTGGVDVTLRDPAATVCFEGQLVSAERDGRRVLLLADAGPFTNAHITEAGNAAVAIGALGAASTLTWFRADAATVGSAGAKRTLAMLTPGWVSPAIALLLLAGVVVALQRGRRLGPIVIERLPVVVRSRETVEGRARLYARGGARLRAADALRIGTIGRIAPMLGLARSAGLDEVVAAAAVATRRRSDELRELLVDRVPTDDRALVRLSDDLARLESAVRAATVPQPNGAR